MTKPPKPNHPCPLCKSEMSAYLDLLAYQGFVKYVRVVVKFSCSNDKCRYEERTKGKSEDMETIRAMQNLAAKFRGPAMFKQGKFTDGSVGVNRRRHTGIYRFEPVPKPEDAK